MFRDNRVFDPDIYGFAIDGAEFRCIELGSGYILGITTRNSAVADKPRYAFVQMQWRG